MKDSKPLSCTVIVPVNKGGEVFEKCVQSILTALRNGDELIVVADGPGDGAWKFAESSGIPVIHLASSHGPAFARNAGAQAARGDILLFIDADITVKADCITRVINVFEKETEIAALIGSYDASPAINNFLSQYRNLFHHFVHQNGSSETFTFWAGCGAIKRQVFLEIGGFNSIYKRPSIEDIELGYRLVSTSHRIRLIKDLQVKHWKQWNTLKVLKTDLFDRAIPWTELILKRQFIERTSLETSLNLGWSYRLGLINSNLAWLSFAAALLEPYFLILSVVSINCFFLLNRAFIHFFKKVKGTAFLSKALFWRFLYDIYSSLGLAIGTIIFCIRISKESNLSTHTEKMPPLLTSKIDR